MEKRKVWLCSIFKNSFLLPAKRLLSNPTVCSRQRPKERRHELVTLYKDMEACAGYSDIQVMWEMVHSSYRPDSKKNRSSKRLLCWKLYQFD